jgi:hypothetical protein
MRAIFRVLIGTQADLRLQSDDYVTLTEVMQFAKQNGFAAYFEVRFCSHTKSITVSTNTHTIIAQTSAKRLRGVREPLDFAVRCVIAPNVLLDDSDDGGHGSGGGGKKKCLVQ